jgi:hypothetical protein
MRVVGGVAVLLGLLIPRPALATPFTASLTISFDPAGSPFAGGTLRDLTFQGWVVDLFGGVLPIGPAIPIATPGPNQNVTVGAGPADIPPGLTSFFLAFSLASFVAEFPVWAFPSSTATWVAPGPNGRPPLLMLGMLRDVPLFATGPLVAFASPGVQVGTYGLKVTSVPEPARSVPEPATFTLFALGLVGLVAGGRRLSAPPTATSR